MGLDSAEIVMEIEDSLGIEFSEDDWASMSEAHEMTVGDLYEIVQQKVQLKEWGCTDLRLNLSLWNEMSELLHSVTNVPQDEIRLSTELEALFPRQTRAVGWQTLRELSSFRIRELDYPIALKRTVGWSVFVFGFVAPLLLLMLIGNEHDLLYVLLVPGLILSPLWGIALTQIYEAVIAAMPGKRLCFGPGIRSVKDLCRSVRAGNHVLLCNQRDMILQQPEVELWTQIRHILSEQLSVPIDDIQPGSRLIRDLGMD